MSTSGRPLGTSRGTLHGAPPGTSTDLSPGSPTPDPAIRGSAQDTALADGRKPASFLERGVAVPFTTPQLAGARIRPAARTGTEFVVPNPSGGRGVYILTWTGVRQLCRPTMHDTLLHQRVSRLPVMDPGGVRLAARQLAAEGMAGREAAAAAAASLAAEREETILVNFLMLVALMDQVEPAGPTAGTGTTGTERTPELDQRARRIVALVAAAIGRSAAQIGEDLERLSLLFVPIGLNAAMPPARLPRLLTRLEAAANGLIAWAKAFPDDSCAALADSLGRSAAVTARCATAAIHTARRMTDDMRGLLRAWVRTPAEVTKQINRAEWILDGWQQVCLLWETAADLSDRHAALREMAQLIPMLPREGNDWNEARAELETLEPALRSVRLNESWRGGGASHALIARNERLRGLIT
jgi:hypothetical protein